MIGTTMMWMVPWWKMNTDVTAALCFVWGFLVSESKFTHSRELHGKNALLHGINGRNVIANGRMTLSVI